MVCYISEKLSIFYLFVSIEHDFLASVNAIFFLFVNETSIEYWDHMDAMPRAQIIAKSVFAKDRLIAINRKKDQKTNRKSWKRSIICTLVIANNRKNHKKS